MREPERAGAARCRQQAHAPREMPSSGSFHCPPFPKGPASQGVGPLWLQEHRRPVIAGNTKCRGHCDMERHSPCRCGTPRPLRAHLRPYGFGNVACPPPPAVAYTHAHGYRTWTKQTHRTLRPDSVGTHAPRQYICLAARLAFHQERKRNASPAHRRPRRTHPQRPLDEPTARRFALAGALLGRRARLSARSRRAISQRGGAPYCSRPHLPVLLHQSRAPRRERAACERWDPCVRGNVQKSHPCGSCRPKRRKAARNAPPSSRVRITRRNHLVYRPRLRTATADPRPGLRRFPHQAQRRGLRLSACRCG